MASSTPRVALESTVIAHGLPYPENLETARRLEVIVRETGALPQTIAILSGEVRVGLSDAELAYLAQAENVAKVSTRDVAPVIAGKMDGATTVATTMRFAHQAGIEVFATGGIGGVHRGTQSFDISADLTEMGRIPITVVSAGPKAILDLPATREVLETQGITVVGYRTDEMPAFYSRTSGLPVDIRLDSVEEIAKVVRARDAALLPTSILVAVPCPENVAIPADEIEPAIATAVDEAEAKRLSAGALTPFLLKRISELTGQRSLEANQALLENNARVAGQLAYALLNLPPHDGTI